METKQTKFDRISDNKIEKIGDMIITMLEQGKNAQWKKPWLASVGVSAANYAYKKPFTGVNDFLLNLLCAVKGYKTPFFMTFDQIKEAGLHLNVVGYYMTDGEGNTLYDLPDGSRINGKDVKRMRYRMSELKSLRKLSDKNKEELERIKKILSEKKAVTITLEVYGQLNNDAKKIYKPMCEDSFPVIQFHYNIYDKDGNRVSPAAYRDMTDEEKGECKRYPSLWTYDEWNIDQTDFAQQKPEEYEKLLAIARGDDKKVDHKKNASNDVLDYMIEHEGGWRCPIAFGGDSAYYSPDEDRIQLPHREQFFTASRFYGTALHEMAHSNKPETKRDYKSQGFYSEGYATEELVAELTAAIMCHDLGIEKTIDEEHIAYVNSWMRACKDKDVIRHILDDLMTSVRYGMNWYEKTEKSLTAADAAA